MYYVVQEKLFREENYENLIYTLERFNLEYEIVKILSGDEDITLKTNRKDIFPFGAVKMAKIAKKYNWNPGSFMTDNHDYKVYSKYYKENLLNYDSVITTVEQGQFFEFPFFTRPTKDTKAFTGRVFNDVFEYWDFFESKTDLTNSILNYDTEIQIARVKSIFNEIRFWIVKGKIVTASMYQLGGEYYLSDLISPDAYDFVEEMINIYQLADTFVMDICLTDKGYKIVECNCTNCSGFYKADMNKLIMSLEESFN